MGERERARRDARVLRELSSKEEPPWFEWGTPDGADAVDGRRMPSVQKRW